MRSMINDFTSNDRRLRSRRVLQNSEGGKSLRDLIYAHSPASTSKLRKISGSILNEIIDNIEFDVVNALIRRK
jgi:hypothetical protein